MAEDTFSYNPERGPSGPRPFPKTGWRIDDRTIGRGLNARGLLKLLEGRDPEMPVVLLHIEGQEARWAMYATVRLVPYQGGGSKEVLVVMGDEAPARVEFLDTQVKHDPNTAPGDDPPQEPAPGTPPKVRDLVRITEGPLAGATGVILKLHPRTHRVTVRLLRDFSPAYPAGSDVSIGPGEWARVRPERPPPPGQAALRRMVPHRAEVLQRPVQRTRGTRQKFRGKPPVPRRLIIAWSPVRIRAGPCPHQAALRRKSRHGRRLRDFRQSRPRRTAGGLRPGARPCVAVLQHRRSV